MKSTRHSMATKRQAVAAVKSGGTIKTVADRFNVHPQTVSNWLLLVTNNRQPSHIIGERTLINTSGKLNIKSITLDLEGTTVTLTPPQIRDVAALQTLFG